MNPPQILIERTAIDALCNPDNERHTAVAAAYLALMDEFEDDQLLLVAVSDHLRPYRAWNTLRRRGPLAAIDSLNVGRQHRRAANRMTDAVAFNHALTLVMCQRHKVTRMLTLDPYFTTYDDLDVQLVGETDDARR
ncbi:MAG: hypothetical protein K8R99_10845 [Actinomycetia bacterium]|nr:hypothetical protein [Actinomycetes bacterium]